MPGDWVCGCGFPLCGAACAAAPAHRVECAAFSERGARVRVTAFSRPNSLYDAVLPLRVLLLKLSNPNTFRLLSLLMDHESEMTTAKVGVSIINREHCHYIQDNYIN